VGEIAQESLVEWMNAADLLCLASDREGCPNAVLEALACGLPVVATPVGAIPDLIPSADYGVLAPSRNPDALADALRHALNTDWNRQAIADRGRSRGWDCVAAELLPLLEGVVGEARTAGGRDRWTS
jgi:glycosyltransferase involved in cell wall biosynthesis